MQIRCWRPFVTVYPVILCVIDTAEDSNTERFEEKTVLRTITKVRMSAQLVQNYQLKASCCWLYSLNATIEFEPSEHTMETHRAQSCCCKLMVFHMPDGCWIDLVNQETSGAAGRPRGLPGSSSRVPWLFNLERVTVDSYGWIICCTNGPWMDALQDQARAAAVNH